jgi:2-iminobutanoate/2-iminopropanoate deaminase
MIAGGPRPVAPFSYGVETDGFVFVTGEMPDTPDAPGKLPDGIEAQHVVMARIYRVS